MKHQIELRKEGKERKRINKQIKSKRVKENINKIKKVRKEKYIFFSLCSLKK